MRSQWTFAALAAAALVTLSSAGRVAEAWGQCGGAKTEASACPEGFICKDFNEYYSQCVKDGQFSEHGLLRRQSSFSYNRITGPVVGDVVERSPISDLQTNQPDVFNMLVLAMAAFQAVPESDPLSYFQIAGIHGRPFIPWGEGTSPTQDPTTGYCTHQSVLFATWHRPYLSLFEQRLSAHAVIEAAKFRGNQATRWQAAARNVRLPYWDWSVDGSRLPTVLTQSTIGVTRPSSSGSPASATITNPFFAYRFTSRILRDQNIDGDQEGDTAATLRWPNSRGVSQNNRATSAMAAGYRNRRTNTYQLFMIPTFRGFTNNVFVADESPETWTSVEAVHGEVHVSIGGEGGHMLAIGYSAFDPVFWLHHANVDRLIALYQAAHPGRVITPQEASETFAGTRGTMDTIDTPLTPFRKSSGQLFTSTDVSSASSIWSYGYAYPEVPVSYRTRSSSSLTTFVNTQINRLYRSTSSRKRAAKAGPKREWLCHFMFSPSEMEGESSQLEIYLGDSTTSDGTFVGSGAAMGKKSLTPKDHQKLITAVVPLTAALEDAGIDVGNKRDVARYLRDHLRWYMKKGGVRIDIIKLASLKVGVSSSVVNYGCEETLPQWGAFETYYEITEKKQCGLKIKDSHLVKSDDAPKLLDDVESAKKESVKNGPVKTEPVKNGPVKNGPVKTEPVKTEPVKTEPVKTEPVKSSYETY